MITLRNIDGSALLQTEVGKGSLRHIELMSSDYIKLKFSLAEPVTFGRGCYCVIKDGADADAQSDGAEWFVLTEPCYPSYNTATGGWDYEAQLNASHLQWQNKLFKYNSEVSWTLTGLIDLHLYAWCKSLNDRIAALTHGDTARYYYRVQQSWLDGYEKAKEARAITYDCADYISALKTLTDTYECEWWVTRERVTGDDNLAATTDSTASLAYVLNVGKCELAAGDADGNTDAPIFSLGGFAEGEGTCTSIKRAQSSGEYATRLFAYGSTKNITARYRKTLEFKADTVSDTEGFSDSTRPLKSKHFATSHKYTRTLDYNSEQSATFSLKNRDDGNELGPISTDTFTAPLGNVVGGTLELTAQLPELSIAVEEEEGLVSMSFEVTPVYIVTYTGTDSRTTEQTVTGATLQFTHVEPGTSMEIPAEAITTSVALNEGTTSVSCRLKVTATTSGEAALTLTGAYTITTRMTVTATNAQSVKAAYCLIEFTSNQVMDAMGTDYAGLLYAAYYNTEMQDTNGKALTFATPLNTVEGNANASVRYLSVETGEKLDFSTLMNGHDGSDITVMAGDTFKIAEGLQSGMVPSGWYARSGADEVAKQQVSTQRLALPQGVECVEIAGLAEAEHVEKAVTNDDIYPTTECEVDSVYSKEREIEDSTTGDVLQTYNQYYLRVSALKDFKKDYIIEGETLHVVFKSGKLNGFDFEVGESWSVTNGQMIIPVKYQDNDDLIIPNIYMYPQAGDTIVLYGYDSTYLSDVAVTEAETRLQDWAVKKLADMYIDGSNFECTADSEKAYNEGSPIIHKVGQKAKLTVKALIHGWQDFQTSEDENLETGGSGYQVREATRDTRIIAVEYPLDYPYDAPVYTVGNSLRYSRLGRIEKDMTGKADKETTFK